MGGVVVPIFPDANPVTLYDNAKRALSECCSIDECKGWADRAAAIKEYARQRDDKELIKAAHRIRGRAVQRIGQLLKQIEAASQANLKQNRRAGDVPSVTRKKAAADAGLSTRKAKQAIQVAGVPEDEFEKMNDGTTPLATIAAKGKNQDAVAAQRPVIDLGGADPVKVSCCINLYGMIERLVAELDASGDPAGLIRDGVPPFRMEKFHTLVSRLITHLEGIRHGT